MDYIYWLSQIQHSEKSLVGNKLYILSQLLQHECRVLPGFALGNNLLRQFLIDLDDFQSLLQELSDSSFHLNVNNYLAIESVASHSRQIIEKAVFPEQWQESIFKAAQQLNTDVLTLQPCFFLPSGQSLEAQGLWRSHTCSVHPQAISKTIKQVWSQLFTAKSLLYWNKLGLSGEKINLAILVKPLKHTYASGIVKITPDGINIKAVWGLESSLIQGDVEPDKYHLERDTGKVLARHLGLKNYAYQVKDIKSDLGITECVESYIPQISVPSYVLDRQNLAVLHGFVQQILQQQPQVKYLTWTVPETKSTDLLDFWFIQFGEQISTSDLSLSQVSTSNLSFSTGIEPLLTGISAAPGQTSASVVVIEDLNQRSPAIPPNSILVTKNIDPHQIHLIRQAGGIITESGGKTSHAAIVARELRIPAIVNAIDATTVLKDGIEVFLHGSAGEVYPASAEPKHIRDRSFPGLPLRQTKDLSDYDRLTATKLMVNISQPGSIENILDLPIDGVGLVRSELILGDLLNDRSTAKWQLPSFQSEFKDRLSSYLRSLSTAFAPRPIYYRSLDLLAQDTQNPILGDRGTYSYCLDSTLFSLELDVLKEIAEEGHHNINLILPFVRGVEEFKFCYRQLQDIGLLDRESFQVWIMAEVPSVIWLLPEYVRAGVTGIALGTNDLTQLILGVDRQQANFNTHGLNANHPAVQKAIAQLIATAKKLDIDCCICGQAPVEYPSLIDKLISWGITTISVEPYAVHTTYEAIARAEKRILLSKSLEQE